MALYLPPSLRQFEPKRIVFSTWMDHLPFAYDIIEAVRPGLLVELGTYNGLSYFAFCQAMKEFQVDGLCYAVDSWEGDAHTDAYDDSIFQSVQQHNHQHYHGFSYLMRMLFNDALQHFEPDTIDLIHIDGLHTYEAVREDFENWYPKVKPGGIMLFHDVAARIKDFGAWRFWQELAPQHDAFMFNHGFGLGVLRKPGGGDPAHPLLRYLFEPDTEQKASLRAFYVHASKFMEYRRKATRAGKGGGAGGPKGGQGKPGTAAQAPEPNPSGTPSS